MARNQVNKHSLEGELQAIKHSYNSFQRRMAYSASVRNYGEMVSAFQQKAFKISRLKKITYLDLESYRETREQIIKDKYASKKFIRDEQSKIPSETTILNSKYDKKGDIVSLFSSSLDNDSDSMESNWTSKYPDQKIELISDLCNQPLAAKTLWDNLSKEKYGQMLLAPPGIGKTYILGNVLKNFIESGMIQKLNCISPWPILYVTKASVVEQTKSVLRDDFNIDVVNTVHVVNIELLRSALGKFFVSEKVTIEQGLEVVAFKWNKLMHPCLFIWDECQILAREASIQSKIACAVNDIGVDYSATVYQISSSATPITRVTEGKHFAASTRKRFNLAGNDIIITNKSWKHFSSQIAFPADPIDYSEEAIKKYISYFEDCIVRVKDINLKYRSFISTQRLNFETKEEHEEYQKAWDHYQEKKKKIEGDESLSDSQSRFALLAQFTIFRKAAEKIRRYHLARFANESWNNGKAPALGLAFKGTMTSVYRILVDDYGWNRNDVSFIWGGSTESLNTKQKLAKKLKDNKLDTILEGMGISMEDLGIDVFNLNEKNEEQYEFEKYHKLLSQKPEEREKERLRFQRQESRLLLFSYKAGGVGLSAHHERKYPNSRPREGLFTPIYSEKEIIQAFGRLPRVTSVSDTYQKICYYGGTIEVDVMARLIMKLKCARHVSRNNDSWEDIITGRKLEENNPIDIPDEDDFDLSLDNTTINETIEV